jgi:hypothetical protein
VRYANGDGALPDKVSIEGSGRSDTGGEAGDEVDVAHAGRTIVEADGRDVESWYGGYVSGACAR